jgi:hypothetical protein
LPLIFPVPTFEINYALIYIVNLHLHLHLHYTDMPGSYVKNNWENEVDVRMKV